MIKNMLDTNICIYLIKKQPPSITSQFAKFRKGEIVISAITWAELNCGIEKDGKEAINALLELLEVVSFDRKAGEIFSHLTIKHSKKKSDFDRLIAAHAIALNVTLVTNDASGFSAYLDDGLKLESWL